MKKRKLEKTVYRLEEKNNNERKLTLCAFIIGAFLGIMVMLPSHATDYTPTTDWSAYQYSKEYYVEKDKARQDMRKMLRYNKEQADHINNE